MNKYSTHRNKGDARTSSSSHLVKAPASLLYGSRRVRKGLIHLILPLMLITASLSAQTPDPDGTFSDLSTQYDGGVASPTDGSTGNVLQQTMLAAYQWGLAHGGARATVVVAAEYPISGSRLLVPGNVDLVCSSYTPENYSGGCSIQETDAGTNTATGGSPLLMVDFAYGFLPDNKTKCSIFDTPQQPGCLIVNGAGAAIRGFSLSGSGSSAGGGDVGLRVAADGVHVQDTHEQFFGGQGIYVAAGVNSSFDWNFGTNVNEWWCAHPSQLTQDLGGIDLGGMLDGEASHNQYSTGCAFAKGYRSSLEYPLLSSMHVGGAGNLIQSNLLQADGIGLIVDGQEHRVLSNRSEYHSREAILNNSNASVFSQNITLSACLDPNLENLRPGSLDSGVPLYPNVPALFRVGQIVMDANGNVEQVIGAANGSTGSSDAATVDWALAPGEIASGSELTWMNIGPWQTGYSDSTDSGSTPAIVSGLCYAVKDVGLGNTWSANLDGLEVGIGGPSYLRGEYDILYPGVLSGNKCHQDWPDAYGNGQCWWSFDWYANGAPAGLAPNQLGINASGGGTAWVGDYSYLLLMDTAPHHYNNFQGMAPGQHFFVGSDSGTNFVDPWSAGDGTRGSVYGHPAVLTCGNVPLAIAPGESYEFVYNADGRHTVAQVNCPPSGGSTPSQGFTVSPGSLTFSAQNDSTASVAQQISVMNTSTADMDLVVSVTGDFSYTSSCGTVLAAGASCTVPVTFDPNAAGQRTGVLSVTDSISGYSKTIALTGLGVDISSTLPLVTLSSISGALQLSPGLNKTKADLLVTPMNGYSGSVTLTCAVTSADGTSTTNSPTCVLTSGTILLGGGIAKALQISVVQTTTRAALISRATTYVCAFPLAGLGAFSLCALGQRRRRVAGLLLLVICIGWLTGCGYMPNATKSATFNVVIRASAGKTKASLTMPLEVQQ